MADIVELVWDKLILVQNNFHGIVGSINGFHFDGRMLACSSETRAAQGSFPFLDAQRKLSEVCAS